MANFMYDHAKAGIMSGAIDLDTMDMRILMVMSNSTMGTEKDIEFLAGAHPLGPTTLDECDGATYARVALAAEAVSVDHPNNRGEFTATSLAPAWATLGVGARQNIGIVVYVHVGADAANIPVYWIDTCTGVGFPFDGNGGVVNITWNAEGIGQVT